MSEESNSYRVVLTVEAPPELDEDDIHDGLTGLSFDVGDYSGDTINVLKVEPIESAYTYTEPEPA